jgi:hypothetical protein
MFNLDSEVWFDAGNGGEEVVKNLLGSHAESAALGGNFQPASFVAKVAFGEIFGADGNEIGVIGEFHIGNMTISRTISFYGGGDGGARELLRRWKAWNSE